MSKNKNNKGQGALEYLLLIGGAVLIAVIVIALLVGLGSKNTKETTQRNEEFVASADLALQSTVLSVICKEKPGDDEYVIKWNPTHKEGYKYTVLFDDKPIIFNNTNPNFDLTPADNPIVFTKADYNTSAGTNPIVADCSNLGSEAISIKTTNTDNNTTAVSNRVFIKPQSAAPPAGPPVEESLTFTFNKDTETGILTITLNPDLTKPVPDGTNFRFIDFHDLVITESYSDVTRDVLNTNSTPYTINVDDIGMDPNIICEAYNKGAIDSFVIGNLKQTLKTIPRSKMTITGCK